MDREIDVYNTVPNRQRPLKFSNNPLVWKTIWRHCCSFLQNFKHTELHSFHQLICLWMPLINAHMHYPIPSFEQYEAFFYYLSEANESKEILHLFIDPHTRGRKTLHIIFNIPLDSNIPL